MIVDDGKDSLTNIFWNNYQYIKNDFLTKMMIELYKLILKNYTMITFGIINFWFYPIPPPFGFYFQSNKLIKSLL